MTTISAKMIADSISPEGKRISTMVLRYPRFIHAEFMTHRVFSRNARSSRAVPVAKMIEEIRNDPVVPLYWGANQKGMQAGAECNNPVALRYRGTSFLNYTRKQGWLEARNRALEVAGAFNDAGYHKQIVNRLLEPFMHIDTLVTGTEWSNFFALRNHEAAEPHLQHLAREMKSCMDNSIPYPLEPGEWHLPYCDDVRGKRCTPPGDDAIMLSVARCARISYVPFDGNADIESERRRYNLLVGSHPMHASPAEHQATPDNRFHVQGTWVNPEQHGNFVGWRQFRKMIPGESQ